VTASPPPPAQLRLLVATPLYDGAQADYLRSIVGLTSAAERAGAACAFAWLSNNAYIDRARNALAAAFLQSDATHLVFIDGDIGFVPEELLDLIARMQSDDQLAVVGAPYPKRKINWNLVAAAAAKGLAEGNPAALERFSGIFPIEPLHPGGNYALDAPIELKHTGTGLMVIRRDVVETLAARHTELAYVADALDREGGLACDRIVGLFQSVIDPDTGYIYGDDFAFCRRAREAGFRIWLAPWMRTSHTGPARFAAALSDLAALSG
jgi:hypothetical protein